MKLLTHNMLACHIKGVKNGYPFDIEVEKTQIVNADYDPDFLVRMVPKLNWPAFLQGAKQMGLKPQLPNEVTPDMLNNDDFLQKFHHCLMEVCLIEGTLICPSTGRRFKVSKGIPNLLLNDDEC
mmetsp:Transcript_7361/g.14500  ORF Transcript_7361/g.14500 Transcript_7361/m.14500 type:complete len:124 (-) Transcript_7361:367-738(-)